MKHDPPAGYPTVNASGGIPNITETENYVKKIDSCMKKMGHSGGLGDANATTCCGQ